MMKPAMNLKKLFEEKGYKYTIQREKIFEILMKHGEEHLTATGIYELVKLNHPDISMATVYRTLLIFEELHIINKLGSENEYNRYEFNANNDAHKHYHLICVKCGQIKDIKENFMTDMSENILEKYHFIVNGYSQRLYGICKDCLVKKVQDKAAKIAVSGAGNEL
ncbi:ferric uptake regulation protein [Oxobacter pfennigii]|uniref:Ferric uptake regulation protein n=1 Tax=Oxobacter pfennigii TaxID=36849 RepID=A0A0P8Z143_9CLOT|nr:Fur family transcriptional regulator [Oxobacter pfennigii]KPU45852.1 ferric uptake regulation protein [Oxobacter pfennigii]